MPSERNKTQLMNEKECHQGGVGGRTEGERKVWGGGGEGLGGGVGGDCG